MNTKVCLCIPKCSKIANGYLGNVPLWSQGVASPEEEDRLAGGGHDRGSLQHEAWANKLSLPQTTTTCSINYLHLRIQRRILLQSL